MSVYLCHSAKQLVGCLAFYRVFITHVDLRFFYAIIILSIGGKISLQFCATDGKKLTPSESECQTLSKKNSIF